MSESLITPENLSMDLLEEVFDAAYMESSIDEDGDLKVLDACTVYLRPDLERKERIRLLAIFAFEEASTMADRLICVNNINNEYIVVTASASDNGLLIFRYDLMLAGGMTKKALVLSVKRFASIPKDAIQDHGSSIVR